MPPESRNRLFEATWVVISVLVSILITDIVKDSVVLLILDSTKDLTRAYIVIPTLFYFLLTAFESYLWLNPKVEKNITSGSLGYAAIQLFFYLCAILAHVFALKACTDFSIGLAKAFIIWSYSIGSIIFFYLVPNFFGLFLQRDPQAIKLNKISICHYTLFAAAFFIIPSFNQSLTPPMFGVTLCGLFVVFVASYLYIWKDWHIAAISGLRQE